MANSKREHDLNLSGGSYIEIFSEESIQGVMSSPKEDFLESSVKEAPIRKQYQSSLVTPDKSIDHPFDIHVKHKQSDPVLMPQGDDLLHRNPKHRIVKKIGVVSPEHTHRVDSSTKQARLGQPVKLSINVVSPTESTSSLKRTRIDEKFVVQGEEMKEMTDDSYLKLPAPIRNQPKVSQRGDPAPEEHRQRFASMRPSSYTTSVRESGVEDVVMNVIPPKEKTKVTPSITSTTLSESSEPHVPTSFGREVNRPRSRTFEFGNARDLDALYSEYVQTNDDNGNESTINEINKCYISDVYPIDVATATTTTTTTDTKINGDRVPSRSLKSILKSDFDQSSRKGHLVEKTTRLPPVKKEQLLSIPSWNAHASTVPRRSTPNYYYTGGGGSFGSSVGASGPLDHEISLHQLYIKPVYGYTTEYQRAYKHYGKPAYDFPLTVQGGGQPYVAPVPPLPKVEKGKLLGVASQKSTKSKSITPATHAPATVFEGLPLNPVPARQSVVSTKPKTQLKDVRKAPTPKQKVYGNRRVSAMTIMPSHVCPVPYLQRDPQHSSFENKNCELCGSLSGRWISTSHADYI
jgi:hypothetical protein